MEAYLKIPCIKFIGQFKCKSEHVKKKTNFWIILGQPRSKSQVAIWHTFLTNGYQLDLKSRWLTCGVFALYLISPTYYGDNFIG